MKTARYVGGPLHGQTATTGAGPWHIYRDDTGKTMKPSAGHREHESMEPPRCYRHARWCGEDLYVHATLWDPRTGGPKRVCDG